METPCNRVCVIAADSGLCRGCWRSIEEIARWSEMTDQERGKILRGLPERRKQARLGAEDGTWERG